MVSLPIVGDAHNPKFNVVLLQVKVKGNSLAGSLLAHMCNANLNKNNIRDNTLKENTHSPVPREGEENRRANKKDEIDWDAERLESSHQGRRCAIT